MKISISERYDRLTPETKRAVDNVALLLASGENEIALAAFSKFCVERKLVAWEVLALKDLVIFKTNQLKI